MTKPAYIFYAIDILSTDDIRRRVPKAEQSASAFRLLARLEVECPQATAWSKSHSRAVMAAAIGAAPALTLGIDVEWMAPGRPFDAIAGMFLSPSTCPVEPLTFYRGWTFFEAYYKAFQRFPGEALVHEVIADHRDGAALFLSDGTGILQFCVADDFRACIVWQHAAGVTNIARI